MVSDVCPICRELSAKAVTAITHHVRMLGKLDLAEIRLDSEAANELKPLIETAREERIRAVEEYRSHRNSHPGEAADAEAAG